MTCNGFSHISNISKGEQVGDLILIRLHHLEVIRNILYNHYPIMVLGSNFFLELCLFYCTENVRHKCLMKRNISKKNYVFFMLNESQFNMSVLKYSNSSIIRLLSLKATSFIWPDFKCTEIVNFYWIAPLKRDHHSYHARCQMHWGTVTDYPVRLD